MEIMSVCRLCLRYIKRHVVAASQPGLGSAVNQTATLKVCALTLSSLRPFRTCLFLCRRRWLQCPPRTLGEFRHVNQELEQHTLWRECWGEKCFLASWLGFTAIFHPEERITQRPKPMYSLQLSAAPCWHILILWLGCGSLTWKVSLLLSNCLSYLYRALSRTPSLLCLCLPYCTHIVLRLPASLCPRQFHFKCHEIHIAWLSALLRRNP